MSSFRPLSAPPHATRVSLITERVCHHLPVLFLLVPPRSDLQWHWPHCTKILTDLYNRNTSPHFPKPQNLCTSIFSSGIIKGKVHRKKSKKKLTSVSSMYVCVAENAELLFFFTFFLHLPHRQFSFIDLCLSSKMYWTFNNVMKWNVFFSLRFAHFSKKVKVLVFRECKYV